MVAKWGILKYLSAEILSETTKIPDFKYTNKMDKNRKKWSKFGVWQFPKRKGARLGKTSRSPLPPATRFSKPILVPTSNAVLAPIDDMSKFMVPFIEKVVDVIGDGHCGFRDIANSWDWSKKIISWFVDICFKSWKIIEIIMCEYMQVMIVITSF